MRSISEVRRLIGYDKWANQRTLDSIRSTDPLPARARLWFPHIVGVQREWLARLQGERSSVAIWPEWTIDETKTQLETLYAFWFAYLDATPAPDIRAEISYQNSRGDSYTNTIADIVQHVLLHSHYHRGQIAAEIRAANSTPAISDFIFALRDPEFLSR